MSQVKAQQYDSSSHSSDSLRHNTPWNSLSLLMRCARGVIDAATLFGRERSEIVSPHFCKHQKEGPVCAGFTPLVSVLLQAYVFEGAKFLSSPQAKKVIEL